MLGKLGKWLINHIKNILYGLGFFFHIIKSTVEFIRDRRVGRKVLVMQILFTGVQALSNISLIAIALGAVIIIQGVGILPQFGQGDLIYPILITIITRELGPLLCAFIIIARSGTAIASEIGSNVVNHEIEAYIASGIDPISYLAVPRFLGVTLSLILLNLYFNFFGLIGSYFITQFIHPIQAAEYFRKILLNLQLEDIVSSVVKSIVFGIIISVVSIYYGFKVEQSSTEIPQMTIKAVGTAFVLCILADALIVLIYYT
ncbi:MAG: ABC transporter permease [Spirochaetales bacterium]|nr:ABC transporter permease [Spirochaetales bacterium]